MVSHSYRILELEEAFGLKNLSPDRGEGVPKDTQLTSGKGHLGLLSAISSVPLLCPFPGRVPLGQGNVCPDVVAKLFRRALPNLVINWILISLATIKVLP